MADIKSKVAFHTKETTVPTHVDANLKF